MQEKVTGITVFGRIFSSFGAMTFTLMFLLLCLSILPGKLWAGMQLGHTDALVRYYVETARDVFAEQDIRQVEASFVLTVVVRRFSLESNLDTLQLDTAVVSAYFSPGADPISDTLRPDSTVVLRSSYLDDTPTLPVLFAKPAWDGEFIYSLFPNDPGIGEIAVSYDLKAPGGGLSQLGASGVMIMDRSSGVVNYVAQLVRSKNNASRYSRTTSFATIQGYSIPVKLVEHISKMGFWENQYEIRETLFLKLRFLEKAADK